LLSVFGRCIEQSKMDTTKAILEGLKVPLEFLHDIEIDAPMAVSHLVVILSDWLRRNVVSLRGVFIDHAPDQFRMDGRPAELAVKVLALRYRQTNDLIHDFDVDNDTTQLHPTDDEWNVVSALMNDDDRKAHPDIREWVGQWRNVA
jgi:hypothetical protein